MVVSTTSTKSVSHKLVSSWETGVNRPSAPQLALLDAAYGAKGVFAQLAQACGTPLVFPPRPVWRRAIPEAENGPAWAWIRPDMGEIAEGWVTHGAFKFPMEEICDERGVFLVSPLTARRPAVIVRLAEPGWVDFGPGVIPEALGVPVVRAIQQTAIGKRLPKGRILRNVRSTFRMRGRQVDSDTTEYFDSMVDDLGVPDKATQFFNFITPPDIPEPPADFSTSSTSLHEEVDADHGVQLARRLRDSRGMSQSYVAAAVSALHLDEPSPTTTPARVTRDQIQSYEEGRTPRGVKFLEGRLDIAYGAHGALTRDEATATASIDGRSSSINFPYFWTGPIWIQMQRNTTPSPAVGEVTLVWRPWQRKIKLRPGQILTTRRSFVNQAPLTIHHPVGWQVIAGIGMPDQAINVEDDWTIIDTRGYFEAVRETLVAVASHRARQREADRHRPIKVEF